MISLVGFMLEQFQSPSLSFRSFILLKTIVPFLNYRILLIWGLFLFLHVGFQLCILDWNETCMISVSSGHHGQRHKTSLPPWFVILVLNRRCCQISPHRVNWSPYIPPNPKTLLYCSQPISNLWGETMSGPYKYHVIYQNPLELALSNSFW